MNAIIELSDLNKLSSKQLRELDRTLDLYLLTIEARQGEDYHATYRIDKKLFKKFLKQTVSFEDNIYAFFQNQASRLDQLVYTSTVKADELDQYLNDLQWEYENQMFTALLEIDIEKFFDYGSENAQIENGIELDLSSQSSPQADFIRSYTLELAGAINDTTKDRIKNQIRISIDTGEDRSKLISRLTGILDNPKRAKVIAQTESVRAFAEGRLAVGEELGWEGKQWRVAPGAEPFCMALQGKTIGIKERFKSGKYEVNAPPLHPNCRCGIKLVQIKEKK